MTAPLLTYAFAADPEPIGVSTTQVSAQARVNISATASSPVYCTEIVIAVPVGDDAPSLYTLQPTGSVNTSRWALTTMAVVRGSDLWTGLVANQAYATFTFDAVSATDYLIDYNLVMGVLGQVCSVTGTAMVAIQETSGTSSDPSTFTAKQGTFPVGKSLPQFYVRNFAATAPASPTVMTTDFANGAPIRLVWESNGTYFQVFAGGSDTPVYAGTAATCTLSSGIARDTTFVLAASMTGSPGQDSPQGGYEPIYLYDALTLSVSDPILTPTSLTVSGPVSVAGTTTLANVSAAAVTATSSSVGDATVTGGLSVEGAASLGSASVTGPLAVTGQLTASGAQLNGLTASGLNGRAGPVALLGGGIMLASGNTVAFTGVQASTDGFAVAQVLTPEHNSKLSFAYASLNTAGTWFTVTGGTVGSFGSAWSDAMNFNPNALTIPIAAGTTWYYQAQNVSNNQENAPSQIWWFPMGSATSAETYETFDPADRDDSPDPPPPPAAPDTDRARATEVAEQLADALAAAMGELMPAGARERFVDRLLADERDDQ